jgi:hypothetical protein
VRLHQHPAILQNAFGARKWLAGFLQRRLGFQSVYFIFGPVKGAS